MTKYAHCVEPEGVGYICSY